MRTGTEVVVCPVMGGNFRLRFSRFQVPPLKQPRQYFLENLYAASESSVPVSGLHAIDWAIGIMVVAVAA